MSWYFTSSGETQGQEKPEEELEQMAQDIGVYVGGIAPRISGENLNGIGRTLLRLFEPYLTSIDTDRLMALLKKLRRNANQTNPPIRKAADALKLRDLHHMLESPEYPKLSPWEKQAIDILLVAFATMSRVAEIIALTTRDVAADGHYISIRAKTYASTCQRHEKRVSNAQGLYPTRVLRKQRAEAILQGRSLLYSGRRGKDVPITSSEVTQALKRATKKLKMSCRITAHSGRKGAAVAVLLSGAPLVVIQSLGLWRCLDSLQAYLGGALRQQFGVLDLLSDNSESGWTHLNKKDLRLESIGESRRAIGRQYGGELSC